MKYVFFGSPQFAQIVLNRLLEGGFIPAAVVCNPDRPVGRKQIITPPAVKTLLQESGLDEQLPVLQPEKLSEVHEQLTALAPDVFIVAAYAKIIPAGILAIARQGSIGVHPSLLPRHRGSSPIQSAILEGDQVTGVTLYLLDEKMDNGPILATVTTPVEHDDTYETLERKLATSGGDLLCETLPEYVSGAVTAREQDAQQATYTKKFTTDDGFVDEALLRQAMAGGNSEAAVKIDRTIRALGTEPGAWTNMEGKRIKLLKAALHDGRLQLLIIQREGKKPETYRG